MRFKVQGKNIEVTPAMEEYTEKKLSGLNKYILIDENEIARVVARTYPTSQKVEVTIPTKAGILRTEVTSEDYYAAVDLAIDKLKDQLRRQKTRLKTRHKQHLGEAFAEEIKTEDLLDEVPIKTKMVFAETMSVDEAILQMELSGHDFYIYTDEETGKHSVIYRRYDGGYGRLETR